MEGATTDGGNTGPSPRLHETVFTIAFFGSSVRASGRIERPYKYQSAPSGKTYLISRLTGQCGQLPQEPTLGMHLHDVVVGRSEDTILRLRFWDVPAQELLGHSTHLQLVLNSIDAAFLVFNPYQFLTTRPLDGWYDMLVKHVDVPMFLIANLIAPSGKNLKRLENEDISNYSKASGFHAWFKVENETLTPNSLPPKPLWNAVRMAVATAGIDLYPLPDDVATLTGTGSIPSPLSSAKGFPSYLSLVLSASSLPPQAAHKHAGNTPTRGRHAAAQSHSVLPRAPQGTAFRSRDFAVSQQLPKVAFSTAPSPSQQRRKTSRAVAAPASVLSHATLAELSEDTGSGSCSMTGTTGSGAAVPFGFDAAATPVAHASSMPHLQAPPKPLMKWPPLAAGAPSSHMFTFPVLVHRRPSDQSLHSEDDHDGQSQHYDDRPVVMTSPMKVMVGRKRPEWYRYDTAPQTP